MEMKVAKANVILLTTISRWLMTYIENKDDPVRIWSVLHDIFDPKSDITLAEALRYIVTLRMADDGDMKAHIYDFMAGKRQVEELGVIFMNIVYCTFFMLLMPTMYQMMVTAIESQAGVMLEAAQNHSLEEWHKRKAQSKGGGGLCCILKPIKKAVANPVVQNEVAVKIPNVSRDQIFSATIAISEATLNQHVGQSIFI